MATRGRKPNQPQRDKLLIAIGRFVNSPKGLGVRLDSDQIRKIETRIYNQYVGYRDRETGKMITKPRASIGVGLKRLEKGGTYWRKLENQWKMSDGSKNTERIFRDLFGKEFAKARDTIEREVNKEALVNRPLHRALNYAFRKNSDFYEESEENRQLILKINRLKSQGRKDEAKKVWDDYIATHYNKPQDDIYYYKKLLTE